MDVFYLGKRLVDDYASYQLSFIKIVDPAIRMRVDSERRQHVGGIPPCLGFMAEVTEVIFLRNQYAFSVSVPPSANTYNYNCRQKQKESHSP